MDKGNLTWQKKVFEAIERGDEPSSIEPLLREGDINFISADEYSPLLYACKYDREDIVKLLIDLGADVNTTDVLNETALYRAAQKGWLQVAKSLVAKGANLNFTGPFGQTPLFAASVFHKLDVLQFLLDAGADPNIQTLWHATSLHLATKMGRLTVVKMLVNAGADVNAPSFKGGIPLHQTNVPAIAEILIRAGADCNNFNDFQEKTSFGRFVLDGLNVDFLELCIEHGAYMDQNDYDTMTKSPEMKEGILQNAKLCALVIANRFNFKDLPELYKLENKLVKRLPIINKLKIACSSKAFKEIELTAKKDINKNGHCNVPKAQPFVLSMLCIKTILNYHSLYTLRKHLRNRWLQTKRSATPEYPPPSKSCRFN